MLEKTLQSPLDFKEIQPVHPKGNQSWIFIGRTDAEAPILWPPDEKNWFTGKDPDAEKDWRQEEKRTTEDKMVGWHHWLDGHEFEQALEVSDGQGSLATPVHGVTKSWTQLSVQLSFKSCFIEFHRKWWMEVVTPWIVAVQAPPLMEFFRQEYWSGLTFPTPGDLSNPGIKNAIPELAGRLVTTKPPGKPLYMAYTYYFIIRKISRGLKR